jgi:hypothetical protein
MSFYQKNIEAIAKYHPRFLSFLPQHQVISRTDPTEFLSIRDWLRRAVDPQSTQVILMGIGKGIPIKLLFRYVAVTNFIIIEQSVERFAEALAREDFTAEFANRHVVWLIGVPASRMETGLKFVKTSLAAHGFQLLQEPSALREHPTYYNAAAREIRKIMVLESFHLRARLARAHLVQRNLIRNVSVILNSCTPDTVVNLFSHSPAFIIAAGPSLDKNVVHLKKAGERGILFCVDTALRTLQNHEIQPHVLITCDPTAENVRHFDGIDLSEDILFAFSPDVHEEIPRRYDRLPHRLCLLDQSARIAFWLKEFFGFHYLLDRPMHVSEAAIYLALFMGCDPIIFVGLDLALPVSGGATHTAFGAHSSLIREYSDTIIKVQTKEGQLTEHAVVKVDGQNGLPVPTFYSFQIYLTKLEELIATKNVSWIDATEGGALKKGSRIQSLEQTVDHLESLDFSVWERIRSLQPTDKVKIEFSKSALQDCLAHGKDMMNLVDQAASGNLCEQEAARVWWNFLKDSQIRTLLDHAVFPYQLLPSIDQIANENRAEFLRKQSRDAAALMKEYLSLWEREIESIHFTNHVRKT